MFKPTITTVNTSYTPIDRAQMDNHEARITTAEADIDALDTRLTTAEGAATTLTTTVNTIEYDFYSDTVLFNVGNNASAYTVTDSFDHEWFTNNITCTPISNYYMISAQLLLSFSPACTNSQMINVFFTTVSGSVFACNVVVEFIIPGVAFNVQSTTNFTGTISSASGNFASKTVLVRMSGLIFNNDIVFKPMFSLENTPSDTVTVLPITFFSLTRAYAPTGFA